MSRELLLLVDALAQKRWFTELPFTRNPVVQYITPNHVVGIVDSTDELSDHTYITAMGLLRVGADTLGVFDANTGSIRDRLNKIIKT